MIHPLHDHELDGVPPIDQGGPVVGGKNPKVSGFAGKKSAPSLRDHRFVEWIVGLSLPQLMALAITVGVLVSAPIVFLLGPEPRAFALLLVLFLPAPFLWAYGAWPLISLEISPRPPRRPKPQPIRPPNAAPRPARKTKPAGWLLDCPVDVSKPDTCTDPDFVRLTRSIPRKMLWSFTPPFLVSILAVGIVLVLYDRLGCIMSLSLLRYGAPEPGSPLEFLLSIEIALYFAPLFVFGLPWFFVFHLSLMIYLACAPFFAIIGLLTAFRSVIKDGWPGWNRSISIALDPMLRLSVALAGLTKRLIHWSCFVPWWLIGWNPSEAAQHLPPDDDRKEFETELAGDHPQGLRPRLFPGLTDQTRGYVLAVLTLLVFALVSNTLIFLTIGFGRASGPPRAALASGDHRRLETLALGCLLVGLSYASIRLLGEVRGPRINSWKPPVSLWIKSLVSDIFDPLKDLIRGRNR
jgi:hypothetical protein